MEQIYGFKLGADHLALSFSLSLWRVSEGVCIQPLPWRYHPQMQLTQVPSGLYPAPPPRSGHQRWPSEFLDQCHAMSAGPPTHRPNTMKFCTYHWITQWLILLLRPQGNSTYLFYYYSSFTTRSLLNILCVCVPAEREQFWGAPWPPALVLSSS